MYLLDGITYLYDADSKKRRDAAKKAKAEKAKGAAETPADTACSAEATNEHVSAASEPAAAETSAEAANGEERTVTGVLSSALPLSTSQLVTSY